MGLGVEGVVGRREGRVVGLLVGAGVVGIVGSGVGDDVGATVGSGIVGAGVGAGVGDGVGAGAVGIGVGGDVVGATVGARVVGTSDGTSVGVDVGLIDLVGKSVGRVLGIQVGRVVGINVGLAEGSDTGSVDKQVYSDPPARFSVIRWLRINVPGHMVLSHARALQAPTESIEAYSSLSENCQAVQLTTVSEYSPANRSKNF